MGYTISEAARITGLSPYTLRYYDNEGLLPFVNRDQSGNRTFKESDFEWLALISQLKKCGMPVKEVARFIQWSMDETISLSQRLVVYEQQKQTLNYQMSELKNLLDSIMLIIENYQKAMDNRLITKS